MTKTKKVRNANPETAKLDRDLAERLDNGACIKIYKSGDGYTVEDIRTDPANFDGDYVSLYGGSTPLEALASLFWELPEASRLAAPRRTRRGYGGLS